MTTLATTTTTTSHDNNNIGCAQFITEINYLHKLLNQVNWKLVYR